jgi:predicted DNA-binding protein with PD1-like motif
MISVKQLTEFTPWAVLSVCCLVAIPAAFLKGRITATEAAAPWSSVAATTFRLKPHEDLMDALLSFTRTNRISAASIVTCVGSLRAVHIRLAAAGTADGSSGFYSNDSKRYEIVSLVGTLEYNSATDKATGHLHIGLADEHGVVIGGHLVTGCRVYTTAEVTLLRCPSLQHTRVHDPDSGYDELMVVPTNDACLSYKAT